MKKLLVIASSVFSMSLFAAYPFYPCEQKDIDALLAANHGDFSLEMTQLLAQLEVGIKDCQIYKPRYYVMGICGALVRMTDYYQLTLNNQKYFELTLDSSFRACQEREPDQKTVIEFKNE